MDLEKRFNILTEIIGDSIDPDILYNDDKGYYRFERRSDVKMWDDYTNLLNDISYYIYRVDRVYKEKFAVCQSTYHKHHKKLGLGDYNKTIIEAKHMLRRHKLIKLKKLIGDRKNNK